MLPGSGPPQSDDMDHRVLCSKPCGRISYMLHFKQFVN